MSANTRNDPEFNDAVPKPKPRRRFSLAGFLVSLGIVVLLAAMMLPATRSAREPARRGQCSNNLKQIALALLTYQGENGALPPAYTVDAEGRPLHSWRTLILPYLEQAELYQTIDLSKPWNDPANAKAREASLNFLVCPSAGGTPRGTSSYLAIVGPNACLAPGRPRRLAEITDGQVNTLMVIEVNAEDAIPWMAPMDVDESFVLKLGRDTKFNHANGMNVCFVDGHVAFLRSGTPVEVRRALMSISGNDNEIAKEW